MITEKEKEYKKEYYLKNKEHIIKYRLENKEIISERSKNYYLKNKEFINEKRKNYHKEYRKKNKEKLKERNKIYYLINKELIKKNIKKYAKNNKEKINLRTNIKFKNNFNFKLKHNLRVRLHQAVKGINKSAPTMKLIGCSVDKLWNHLESKFKPWMTRENYGLWHVDHKIACAKFNLTCPEQQRICFHYTNLQPMEAIENMRKGAR